LGCKKSGRSVNAGLKETKQCSDNKEKYKTGSKSETSSIFSRWHPIRLCYNRRSPYILSAVNLLQKSTFNPYEIDENVTIDNIIRHIKEDNYLTALIMSLRLSEPEIIQKVFKCIPQSSIPLICSNFPGNYVFRFLEFLQRQID